MASLRGVRDQVRELRAEIAPGRQQRLIAVSTTTEAEEVQARLGPGEKALIVITGVPRQRICAASMESQRKSDTNHWTLRNGALDRGR